MDFLNQLFGDINSVLWGVFVLIPLLCGTGIFYTFKLRFVQIRLFPTALRFLFNNATLFGKRADQTGMSSFQALATAVAAQVGTGNVAGAATAIVAGGPGALFWLWVAAFFGMATIFAEAVLAQIYRVTGENDRVVGGPAFYMSLGLGPKFKPMAVFFSAVAIITMGCMGSLVQSNTVSQALNHAFDVPLLASGIGVAILSGVVMFGGMGRLASVTEKLVPFMAGLYLIGGSYVLACHYDQIIPAFDLVFTAAFNPEAVGGGALGLTVAKAMQFGVARGLFSNEAGVGAAACAAGSAGVSHPVKQGLVQVLSVFLDTCMICTATAMLLLCSGVEPDADMAVMHYVQAAMNNTLGKFGVVFITVSLFLFAFTTLLGNFYYAETGLAYLCGMTPSNGAKWCMRIVAAVVVCVGATMKLGIVWDTADVLMGFMALINVPVIVILLKPVLRCLEDYTEQKKAGKNPVFKAEHIGLKEKVDFWN